MAHSLASAVVVFVIWLILGAATPAQGALTARVTAVSDGDTMTVLRGKQQLKVRLQGVDCPEGGQAFGAAAKTFTSDLVFGKTVTVHPRTRDRYGRMVADVTMDGKDVGLALMEAGFAWHRRQVTSTRVR